MSLRFDIAGNQIDGARDYQEDAFLITHLGDQREGDNSALVIVADGMGGHAAGNVASNMAVQSFNKYFSAHYDKEDVHEVLAECVRQGNNAIAETVRETAALKGMGCTLVAAYFKDDKLWWASVGDSHLYLLRDGELSKLNADHSYGAFLDRMEAAGNPVEPEAGFARNMLMSALTGDEIAETDCPAEPLQLQPGDRLIMASDGLDTLSHGKIISYCKESETAKDCSEALLQGVEDAGMPRQDNATAVVINISEDEDITSTTITEREEPNAQTMDLADRTQPPHEVKKVVIEETVEVAAPGSNHKTLIMVIGLVVIAVIAAGTYMLTTRQSAPVPQPGIALEEEEQAAPVEATGPGESGQTPPPAPVAETAPAATEKPAPVTAPVTAAMPAVITPAATATKTEAARPGPAQGFRDKLKSGGEGPEMVWLPAGDFLMGAKKSSPDSEEKPQHKVHIQRLAMSRYEVTIAQYERFAKATGRKLPDTLHMDKSDHPIINVSWDDAIYYASWLSKQSGHKYRLPSEAEWEYAARAGTPSSYWWGNRIGKNRAHCFGCGAPFNPRKPAKIGSFAASPFGLYDTAGNVMEWVQDCWHNDYNHAPDDGSVWEGGDCARRVIRGGSYSSPARSLRPAKRDSYRSNHGYDNVGIRLVREP